MNNEVVKISQPIEQKSSNTTSIKSFHYLEDGSVDFSILETKYSTKELTSGVYNLKVVDSPGGRVPKLSTHVNLENLSTDLDFYYEDKIKNIYNKFFLPEIKDKINFLGYNHKASILLHGKQGTGKTSMFKKYFNKAVIEHEALVFDVSFSMWFNHVWDFIKDVRKIQNNPIIIFLDEFEEYFTDYSQETDLKKILDGTESIDNCLFFLTTNYLDKIPETIKDRPSRVKYVIEVTGIQDKKIVEQFLKESFLKVGMEVDFKDEVSKMKGWTIDELKQWVLDKIMDLEPEVKKTSKIGFGK